ncbi:hypothetical protein XAC3810_180011 [Xanthomonas citri pv. citri]|uniref:Uncharacterized protein n=1 Tax=Xanthomonas citri pv. citri TaxID=611301 RepID=A0A0U4YI42_XANCI|nr:hypothetical protein XAC9322_160010 [Xanthomonas citri pv. citri]CEE18926.1 hypothetical protein XAC3824_160010 [Xanthomonas citri pv. citri]CEE19852.1 hypothetical protein XAC1083_160011 [Xanthomonas citri pv. citri]CEE27794.1 hypothetical protein XAC3810_180011 [Xanthomonas citri pv. citri]CEE29063.1 hypothetical protein XAC2911_150010 [Xanthomonas citri pv. citri]
MEVAGIAGTSTPSPATSNYQLGEAGNRESDDRTMLHVRFSNPTSRPKRPKAGSFTLPAFSASP